MKKESATFDVPDAATKALEKILIEKGLVSTDGIDRTIEMFEREITAANGARVVAHAWKNPSFKSHLLKDAPAAMASIGIGGLKAEHLVVVENTEAVHNLVCCTLCSCYPWAILGLPPSWYKDPAYRSRAVLEPRAVLKEFGLDIDPTVEIRVWDSNSDVRYLVLPQPPTGWEDLTESELAKLVSRDALIGVALIETLGS